MKNVNLILGTMTFGESVFSPDVKEFINTYLDSSYNELDTAYVYNEGNCERLLGEALKEIDQLMEDYKTCYVGDPERTYNMAFVNYCEIGSMLTVAKALAMGALHRRESRGAHIREDHPKRNDERYLKHSLIKLGADGQYELTERDVVFTKYEPQERKY